MTLDQANTTSTMVYGDNYHNGSNNNNNNHMANKPGFNRSSSLIGQNMPSSPLLTYSFMNSPSHNNNGSFMSDNSKENVPQLSLSLMSLNAESHHDNLISTSTSPSKLPYSPMQQSPTPHHHQQSLSLDSNALAHQRDLSPRFDVPFGNQRQRGNSSGFPPIGGHLTKISPRVDVNPSSAVYNQGGSNSTSRYHNPQSPALPPGGYDNHGYVGSPLMGSNTSTPRSNVKLNSSFSNNMNYYGPTVINQNNLFGSNEVDQQLSFGMMPSHISPSISPSNSPRHVDFSSGKITQQPRALLQGGRSNSMPPIPAFTSSTNVYSRNEIDMDRMNNYISKSVNMKILEEDESDSFESYSNNPWYQSNGLFNGVNNNNGYGDEQYIVGHMDMSPSQGSPLMASYQSGYLDANEYSSPSMGYKLQNQGGFGNKQNNSGMPYGMGINVFPNTSNIQMASHFTQAHDSNQLLDNISPNGSSTDSDDDGKSHKHPGEYPSRTLFVRNISSNVDDQELRLLFESFGPIRQMYTSCKHRGFVMITYYDIRHAKQAKKNLQSKLIKKRKIDIHYSIPKENPPEKEQLNQETLVVFNLDPSITNEELKTIFTQFGGDVKEIRETPNKKFHKFIEFYDTRDAERAVKQLNKSELKGKKIKIEYSRPGGLRNKYPSDSSSSDSPTTINPPGNSIIEAIEISSASSLPTTPNMEALSPPKNDALLQPGNKSRRPRAISAEEKEQFKLDLEKVRCGIDKRTTLMVKNIPNKYTQKMLLETVDTDFKTSYDFFYLPIDFKNKCNVGYAFINFVDPKLIIPFVERFNRKKWEKFNSEKVCDITYARIQGKIALINHFQNSSLMCEEEDCRPIFC